MEELFEILQTALTDQEQLLSYLYSEREHSEGKRAYEVATIDIVNQEIKIEKTKEFIAKLMDGQIKL